MTYRLARWRPRLTLILLLPLILPTTVASSAHAATRPRLWVQRYDDLPVYGFGPRGAATVSPDGSAVFVAHTVIATSEDYLVLAYDAASGTPIWTRRYDGPGHGLDLATAIAVDPVGSSVFVTGTSDGRSGLRDVATIALDAATGARRWVARYEGNGTGFNGGDAILVSPDGSTVFVTGTTAARKGDKYVTLAYDAKTGARIWRARSFPAREAASLAISPNGSEVFIAGTTPGAGRKDDYVTVALDAATGSRIWVRSYEGVGHGIDIARAIGVSVDGARVFVTGRSDSIKHFTDYATVAYDASTGATQWVKRYNGPGNLFDVANALSIDPTGSNVYVTGSSDGGTTSDDYATVAYDASTGARRWVVRYNGTGNGNDSPTDVGVSPHGTRVFVTGNSPGIGSSDDYATIAYRTSDGSRLWTRRYDGPAHRSDDAGELAVDPDGTAVYVTGISRSASSVFNAATVAYRSS